MLWWMERWRGQAEVRRDGVIVVKERCRVEGWKRREGGRGDKTG